MNFKQCRNALIASAKDLILREEELSRLDSFVGDGDHGVTIRKGYQNVLSRLESEDPQSISALFYCASMAMANTAGGAIGPILSSFFLGLSSSTKGKEELKVSDLADMFAMALANIQELGGAQPGDRTMVDALYPMVCSLQQTKETDEKKALREAAEKACEGAKATAKMVAKKGRARYLAEKSLGYVDAGATSMAYFIRAFAEAD